jgi:PAS domain S-box-containing protein
VTERARILVIDDDADLLRLTSILLKRAGHEVLEATTGADGLRLTRELEPDLILLDMVLPDMNGLEVCRQIKSDAGQGSSFVVFLSAFQTGPDDHADGLEAGADGYITRPIANRELLAHVQAMLRVKRAEDALRDRTHQLGERVKELNCLYGISQLVEKSGISLDEILQGTVHLIPPSWQYPEITCARIILEDREFRTDNFQETPWRQAQDIEVHGNRAGGVEVIYLQERPTIDEGPFLKEERSLVNAVAALVSKIVERMRAEEALRENERRDRYLLEALQEGIWVIDQDAYTTFVNPRMAEMLGYSAEEMQGKHLFAFMDERGVEISKRNLKRREQGIKEQHDFEFLRKDGSRMYASLETSPIHDDDGNYMGAIAGIQDITERVMAEEALRASEEKYRDLVEKVSDVIYTLDAEGRITYVNPAIESLIGYGPLEVVGRPLSGFIAPEDVQRGSSNFQKLVSGESLDPKEYRVVTKSGEVRWMSASSQPILEGDRVIGVRGVLTDITDRKMAQEQLEETAAGAERERLARELHDAVTQALFSASLIADTLPRIWERDQAEGQRGLEEIYRLTHGALAEMRNLLFELRPDALGEQDLGVLLRQLTAGMMARTRTSFTTTVEGSHSLPGEVRVVLYRIAQEALNNVTKHAQAGEATVRLQNEPDRVTLRICDNGKGFEPEGIQPERLGLRIMRERAQAIGATFSINSQPEQGTEVTVVWSDNEQPMSDGGRQ